MIFWGEGGRGLIWGFLLNIIFFGHQIRSLFKVGTYPMLVSYLNKCNVQCLSRVGSVQEIWDWYLAVSPEQQWAQCITAENWYFPNPQLRVPYTLSDTRITQNYLAFSLITGNLKQDFTFTKKLNFEFTQMYTVKQIYIKNRESQKIKFSIMHHGKGIGDLHKDWTFEVNIK